TLLAPPPRGNITNDANDGERVFERIGCDSCHVATLRTGSSSVAALDRTTYHPYSDFLLHDMGSLGDGVTQGDARGRERRRAPHHHCCACARAQRRHPYLCLVS